MQAALLYDHALRYCHSEVPDFASSLARWRAETPASFTDQDLLAEYAWVVVGCGLTYFATRSIHGHLAPVLLQFDPAAVYERERELRIPAAGVLKSRRKLDAIWGLAGDLTRDPGQMRRLAAMPVDEVVGWMRTHPLVGENNCWHWARNLGWDVAVRTGPVGRLASKVGTDSQSLCQRLAAETGEKTRVIDLVLWQWAVQAPEAQLAAVAEFARMAV